MKFKNFTGTLIIFLIGFIITKLGIGSAAVSGSIRGGALFLIVGSIIEAIAALIAFFKVYNYYRKH